MGPGRLRRLLAGAGTGTAAGAPGHGGGGARRQADVVAGGRRRGGARPCRDRLRIADGPESSGRRTRPSAASERRRAFRGGRRQRSARTGGAVSRRSDERGVGNEWVRLGGSRGGSD